MSISNAEKYYGAVILRVLEKLGEVIPRASFSITKGDSQSSFAVHGLDASLLGKGKKSSIGLFIKLSYKRRSPWRYNFDETHQNEIEKLKKQYGQVFIAFVAEDDGIACINFNQLKLILDHNHEEQEWVSVSRKLRQNYRVKGNDGSLDRPLPRNSFPDNVVTYFDDAFN
ncbi:hypothetical protein N9R01_00890 [Porticoccaceae bacterium]|nr:hypothetical protein [Porticoccaceae bacterium]